MINLDKKFTENITKNWNYLATSPNVYGDITFMCICIRIFKVIHNSGMLRVCEYVEKSCSLLGNGTGVLENQCRIISFYLQQRVIVLWVLGDVSILNGPKCFVVSILITLYMKFTRNLSRLEELLLGYLVTQNYMYINHLTSINQIHCKQISMT